jgi:uncharacterized FlgJ-related protein
MKRCNNFFNLEELKQEEFETFGTKKKEIQSFDSVQKDVLETSSFQVVRSDPILIKCPQRRLQSTSNN